MLNPPRKTRAVRSDLGTSGRPLSATDRIHQVHIRKPRKQDPRLHEQATHRRHDRTTSTRNVIRTHSGSPLTRRRTKPTDVIVVHRLNHRGRRRNLAQRRLRLPLRHPRHQTIGMLVHDQNLACMTHPHRMRMHQLKPVPCRRPLPPRNRIHPPQRPAETPITQKRR